MENGTYPKWLYHPTEEACIVQNKDEHNALGIGWEESPYIAPEFQAPEVQHKLDYLSALKAFALSKISFVFRMFRFRALTLLQKVGLR